MSPSLHILRDLLPGPSTADSTAGRVNMDPVAVTSILVTLKRENLVTSEPLGGLKQIHVYRLTLAGKNHVQNPQIPIENK